MKNMTFGIIGMIVGMTNIGFVVNVIQKTSTLKMSVQNVVINTVVGAENPIQMDR
jgi:hypothetical protein